MKVSSKGLKLIREKEGFEAKMYKDKTGNCTIGYGYMIHKGLCLLEQKRANLTIKEQVNLGLEMPFSKGLTRQGAEKLLLKTVARFERIVNSKVKNSLLKLLTQDQFDALVSLVYNIGEGNFASSTLLKLLNKVDDYKNLSVKEKQWLKKVRGRKDVKNLSDKEQWALRNFRLLDVGEQFLVWNKGREDGKKVFIQGLFNRRVTEKMLFDSHFNPAGR